MNAFHQLPSAEEAERWALDIVGHQQPLEVEYRDLGVKPTLAVEINGSSRRDWQTKTAVLHIAAAVYPSDQLTVIFDKPGRQTSDVPRDRHEIYLDRPLIWPVVAKVISRDLMTRVETYYSLYLVHPELVEDSYRILDPDYEGLTRVDTDRIARELGLWHKHESLVVYSTTGLPQRLANFCPATAVQLPSG